MFRALREPRILAVLAGAGFAFAAAPTGLAALVFVAPIAWLAAARLACPEPDMKTGAKLGLVVGFVCHVIGFYWVVPLFTEHVPIPWPIALLGAGLVWFSQALPFAFVGALTETLHAARLPRSIALAIAMPIGFELVWTLFPWRPAEIAVDVLVFAQIADLSGPSLLETAIVLASAGLVEGLGTRNARMVALGAFALVAPLVYGTFRIRAIDALERSAPVVRIGAVQPNVMQTVKFEPQLAPAHIDNLRTLTTEVEARGVDFSVWPETSYPWPLPRDLVRDPIGRHGVHHRERVRGPVLFGALTFRQGCDHWNSALAMDRYGHVVGVADKVVMFPFSERVPYWEYLTFLHGVAPCPGFASGDGPQIVDFEGSRIGILNCYEDLLPWYARAVARERPDYLLNITNDAWFLDTSEPYLHHMAARLRAIESRRELLRVVNTGLTGRIDAVGRRHEELPVWTRGTMVARVRKLPTATSPYLEHGDVVTPALLVLAILATMRLAWLRLSGASRAT